jgi:hypothetical protein
LNVSRLFQLASKFSSLSSNCLALTKFRIACTKKNVCWSKTFIHIENKMTVDWLLTETDCWLRLIIDWDWLLTETDCCLIVDSKEIFKSKSLILFFVYENQKW